MDAREEAIDIFAQVIQKLSSPNQDLKACLRLCQHACQLLDWENDRDWFHRELSGYPPEISRPNYRIIPGELRWVAKGSALDRGYWESSTVSNTIEGQGEATTLDVWESIDWILKSTQTGAKDYTEEEKTVSLPDIGTSITIQRVKILPAANFASAVNRIENITYSFASKSYVQLRYGNTLGDIWSEYRDRVEVVLGKLNLANHLSAIHEGIESENSEAWRNAVLGCRNLLKDLADYLWQDPRPTYDHLNGQAPNDKLEVTKDKSKNRLSAYLHKKAVSGQVGRHLRDELEHLSSKISSLISLQSKAHEPLDQQLAKSIALATLFVIGELDIRTDMVPIQDYDTVIPNLSAIRDEN